MSSFPLDETGNELGKNGWFEQRIRVAANVKWENFTVRVSADVLSGILGGDTSDVGARFVRNSQNKINTHNWFMPRRAMLAWRTDYGELRLGHQISNWGFGILANNGEHKLEFGDQYLGDLVERIAFATSPIDNFFVAVGGDLVFRDSNAELSEGDVGLNGFGSLFFRDKDSFAGAYVAHRYQWDRDGERLNVTAIDFHCLRNGTLFEKLDWEAGFEGLILFGNTNRIRPEPGLGNADVLSGGAVLKGRLFHKRSRVSLSFETGYASGDNDRNDATVRNATFHPDYRVGLILFDQLLGGLTANAADRLADSGHQAQAPHGTQHVPSNEGVTNALYFWPQLAYSPLDKLKLRVGLLWARSVADVVDPYFSNTNAGGMNRNFFNGPANEHHLGTEVQISVRYHFDLLKCLKLYVGVEGARLFPGAAFSDANGREMPTIDRIIGRVVLDWRPE
ncbi:MAG: hypothetical protein V1754_11545 [Pseudomonadota bacterium]